jgi:hypothetical protein
MVDYNATQKFLTEKNLHFSTFYTKADKPVKGFHGLIVKTGTKAELPLQLSKASLTLASTYLLSYQQKQQGSAYRLETLKISLQLFINLCNDCGVTQTSQSFRF